ncbi:nucleoplasmin-2b [Erpetoichthys calabaricus]|uniref:nucleoplasmin-2b n=1 Tax=Erpetoichthys calabaricus TaxID=27687 RepID=UPI002234D9BF|nr:nucleoplasmin-2b [Erpetoichthys calabaricus]
MFSLYKSVVELSSTGAKREVMASADTSKTEKPLSLIWGCELSDKKTSYTFASEDTKYQHQLALRTVCLGADAKDEFNVVEIIAKEESGDESPVPFVTLKPSVMPTVTLSGIELPPPVCFRLKSGSGPVYISGQHVALEEDLSCEEEIEEEEEEVEEEMESPPKPVKRSAPNKKVGQTKRKRTDKKEEDDEECESEENSPPKAKGRGRKPAGKK